MEQIRRIMRPTDVPDQGLLCDLLWSDPDKDVLGWGENDRGVSFTFGSEVVAKFLHKHDLDLICRAHQVNDLCSLELWLWDVALCLQTHSIQVVQDITRCAENWYTLHAQDSVSPPFWVLTLKNKEMSTSSFYVEILVVLTSKTRTEIKNHPVSHKKNSSRRKVWKKDTWSFVFYFSVVFIVLWLPEGVPTHQVLKSTAGGYQSYHVDAVNIQSGSFFFCFLNV